jgi:hypothetical protein
MLTAPINMSDLQDYRAHCAMAKRRGWTPMSLSLFVRIMHRYI